MSVKILEGNLDLNGGSVVGQAYAEMTAASAPSTPATGKARLYHKTDKTLAMKDDAGLESVLASIATVTTMIATAVSGLFDLKGDQDCSANPNYPAASKGDAYVVTGAGKIGGGSGKDVEVGDIFIAKADNAGGTEASVGTSWFVMEHNLAGALLRANNLSDVASASTALANLGGAATAGTLAQFAATTSAQLAGVISDETGSGSLVFGTSPAIVTPTISSPQPAAVTGTTGTTATSPLAVTFGAGGTTDSSNAPGTGSGIDWTLGAGGADTQASPNGGTTGPGCGGAINIVTGAAGSVSPSTGTVGGYAPGGINIQVGASANVSGGTVSTSGRANPTIRFGFSARAASATATSGNASGGSGGILIIGSTGGGQGGGGGDATCSGGSGTATGGSGGTIAIGLRIGGAASGGATNTGGAGTLWSMTETSTGGAASGSSATNTGGQGSRWALTLGAGGAASGSSSTNTGGLGGNVTITLGAGGAASGGSSNTGGAGGFFKLSLGAAGSGATAAGAEGYFGIFASGGSTRRLHVSDTGVNIGSGTTKPGVDRLSLQGGTSITTGDVALSGSWGASATVTAVTGNDSRGTITVTTNAADTPTANPTVTLTFKDGTWTNTPFPTSNVNSDSTGPLAAVGVKATATTLVLTYVGTPTATSALTYIFNYHVQG